MDQAKLILLGKTTGLYTIGKQTGSCFQGEASMIVRKTRSRSRAERASGPMVERIASRPGSVVSTSCRGGEWLSFHFKLFSMWRKQYTLNQASFRGKASDRKYRSRKLEYEYCLRCYPHNS